MGNICVFFSCQIPNKRCKCPAHANTSSHAAPTGIQKNNEYAFEVNILDV